METGGYGVCASCGRDISTKRLEAVPWTELCRECADSEGVLETNEVTPRPWGEMRKPTRIEPRASDEEIQEEVLERLRGEPGIETQELGVSVANGVVALMNEGILFRPHSLDFRAVMTCE